MNTEGTGFHSCKECHKTESLWNHTTTEHKEGEQLEDRRSVGASSCNCGDGTDQRVQSVKFMMMMMMKYKISCLTVTLMRFVIPIVFYEITNVQCVYWSNTTVFIGKIYSTFYIR